MMKQQHTWQLFLQFTLMMGSILTFILGYMSEENLNSSKSEASNRHDLTNEIRFLLYTRKNKYSAKQLYLQNSSNHKYLNENYETQIFIHGWLHNKDNFICAKNGLLKQKPCNVIIVDWKDLAFNEYFMTAKITVPVGEYIALFVDSLVQDAGLKVSNLHIVGHSFGAHIAGIVGNRMKMGLPSRLTGLDASLVPFKDDNIPLKNKLDPSDAQCVQVVHTGGGKSGMEINIGHGDFYPNGGVTQPGCHLVDIAYGLCSHLSVLNYHEQWCQNPGIYEATKCDTWYNYEAGHCSHNHKAFMVQNFNRPCPNGSYFLKVNNTPTYFRRRKCDNS